MGAVRNILFVMYDQLRFDYLSCAGHPTLHTPNFDRLAAMGVRFSRAYVQSPVCGPSRMSSYTGRYVSSHGAAYNNYPLKVGEQTLGDHLRAVGVDSWLIGKTHMKADAAGMARLGLAPDSVIGARVSECGFDIWERDDGLWSRGPDGVYDSRRSPYNEWLKGQGYPGDNPWHDHANSGVDDQGDVLSGWYLLNSDRAANIAEPDSETPWLTGRCIDFLASAAAVAPWLCHLSYIKPHWPYVVPEPWASRYGAADVPPALRDPAEQVDPHPIYGAFMANRIGQAFARDDVRTAVIPAYMGLIAQCDAEFGRLLDHLQATGRLADTMIVLTSDHGDYLGDHWLGEKDLFHDPSVRVPLIVYDPSAAADATRGTVCDAPVEAIDLVPTFLDALGAEVPGHVLEGRSLLPWLHGIVPAEWRAAVVSEYDWSTSPMAADLGVAPKDARLMMAFDGRWKLIHAEGGFRPMLFDLQSDWQEYRDLGADPAYGAEVARMYGLLNGWARRMAQRTTVSDAQVLARRQGSADRVGLLIGVAEESEVAPDVAAALRGRAGGRFTP